MHEVVWVCMCGCKQKQDIKGDPHHQQASVHRACVSVCVSERQSLPKPEP